MVIILYRNYTNLVKFQELSFFTVDECVDLMKWHINNKYFKIGLGNNLSLINWNVDISTVSDSLIYYKPNLFYSGYFLVIPFKIKSDKRNLLRFYCKVSTLKNHMIIFDSDGNDINEDKRLRNEIITTAINKFSWHSNYNDKIIYRYRLNLALNTFNFNLSGNIHSHHLSGLVKDSGGLRINDLVIDDRLSNLLPVKSNEHRKIHIDGGDFEYENY